jgi:uncharacterized protein (TIGR02285 family)
MRWFLAILITLLVHSPRLPAAPLVIVDSVAILKDLQSGQNLEGRLLQHILDLYPDRYQTESFSRNRAREWIKTAGNACIPWLKKTAAREQDYLFTLPYMVEDALVLVLPAQSAWHPKLLTMQGAGQLSFGQLLQLPAGPLVGVEFNRSYGEQLDQLLVQHQHSRSLYVRTSSSEDMGSLIPMLERGFIDGLLEYQKVAERSGLTFRYYRLQEAEPMNLVHFACSKGTQGEAVVTKLNQAILQASQQPEYQQLVLQGIASEHHATALAYWLKQLSPQ